MLVGDFMVPKASLPPSLSSSSSGSSGSVMSSNEKTTTSRRLSKGSIELAAYNGGGDALRPSQPPSATKKRKREGESASGSFRLIIFVVGSIMGASVSLLVVASKRETWKVDGKGVESRRSTESLCILMSECIKLVVSLVCYSLSGSPSSSDNLSNEGRLEAFRVSLLYAVPALLYTIDNNLIFVILEFLDPAEMAVMWNFKIVTTAVLAYFFVDRSTL